MISVQATACTENPGFCVQLDEGRTHCSCPLASLDVFLIICLLKVVQECSKLILTTINSDALPFPKNMSLKGVTMLRNLQDYVVTLLRDRGGGGIEGTNICLTASVTAGATRRHCIS